jgi:hypothetical protein
MQLDNMLRLQNQHFELFVKFREVKDYQENLFVVYLEGNE